MKYAHVNYEEMQGFKWSHSLSNINKSLDKYKMAAFYFYFAYLKLISNVQLQQHDQIGCRIRVEQEHGARV